VISIGEDGSPMRYLANQVLTFLIKPGRFLALRCRSGPPLARVRARVREAETRACRVAAVESRYRSVSRRIGRCRLARYAVLPAFRGPSPLGTLRC
jgi:hypothetical protein